MTCIPPPDDGVPLEDGRYLGARTIGSDPSKRVYVQNPIIILPSLVVPLVGVVTATTAVATSGLITLVAGVATIGPFGPELGRKIRLSLWGDWTGPVQLLRSVVGGPDKLPITSGGQTVFIFSGPINEWMDPETEFGASLFLTAAVTTGTLNYRMAS